jgi:hypothetical protein
MFSIGAGRKLTEALVIRMVRPLRQLTLHTTSLRNSLRTCLKKRLLRVQMPLRPPESPGFAAVSAGADGARSRAVTPVTIAWATSRERSFDRIAFPPRIVTH